MILHHLLCFFGLHAWHEQPAQRHGTEQVRWCGSCLLRQMRWWHVGTPGFTRWTVGEKEVPVFGYLAGEGPVDVMNLPRGGSVLPGARETR